MFKNNLKMNYQQDKSEDSKQTPYDGEKTEQLGGNAKFDINKKTELDRKLRMPRSEMYLQLFDAIDILSATDEEIIEKIKSNLDEEVSEDFLDMSADELREEIRLSFVEEFESMQIEIKSVLQGVLAKCYITGCDCHAITTDGYILDHFSSDKPIPSELQKARPLLVRYGDDCKCVEVYTDCCRVIMEDSSVITIDDKQ